MNAFSKFFSIAALAILTSALPSFAADNSPGYGLSASRSSRSASRYNPEFFRPTQRYYGRGYTVAYRFVPYNNRMRGASISMWDIDEFQLPTAVAATTYASGNSPRITYFNRKAVTSPDGAPSGNTSIVDAPKPLPPVAEGPAKR